MTTDPTDLRDRIADVLAAADGWQWVTDRDKARSSTYRSYQSRADAVLKVLPSAAPTPPTEKADAGSGRAAEAELYVLLRKAGEDRYEAQALIDRHRDEVLHRAELRRVAAEAQQQEPTAHGCTIDGQPAMPILVAEYNQLVTRAAEAGAHRLALSFAVGLGTGAPWDAIRDRAAELHGADAQQQEMASLEDRCAECGHFRGAHENGRCIVCADDEARHDYEPTEEVRRLTEAQQQETDGAARVRALHRKASHGETCVYCAHGQRLGYDTTWPCDTIRALDGAEAQQQPDTEAHPPHHRWSIETRDAVADQWPPGTPIADRDKAVERYEHVTRNWPTWKDGLPVERRLVRATTTYTVEEPAADLPAADGEATP
ncbi:hypothetical protein [Streptomyces cadmiisoli]|uniref:hypothetical protein n=1 Tax=Streptomyces cadmiisoli TaxID=2184053 RepID=UPI00364ECEED